MMRPHIVLSAASGALLAGLLGGCTMMGPGGFEVHEADLYGSVNERIVWVYGDLGSAADSRVQLAGQEVTLRPQVQDPLAVPGTLSVNGASVFRAPTSEVPPKISVTRDTTVGSFVVRANEPVQAVYFTEGQRWFKLTGALEANTVTRAQPAANTFLSGAGALTDAEAAALGGALLNQGPLAVAVLPESQIPDAPLAVSPAPQQYARTGLYVQAGVPVSASAQPTPERPAGGTVDVNVLDRGSQAGYSQQNARAVLADTSAELQSAWRLAHANQVPAPAVPNVDLTNRSVVLFFLGQRPTGGYGVNVTSAQAREGTLTLTVNVMTPPPGAITTQALTSPWVAVSVPGRFEQIIVQDQNGREIARAR